MDAPVERPSSREETTTMKRKLSIATTLVLMVVAALSGCGMSTQSTSPLGMNSGTGGATAVDVARLNAVLVANPGLVNESEFTTSAQMPMDLGSGGLSLIRPIRWWRIIDSTQRVVDWVYADPDSNGRPQAAVATVHKHFTGWFVILAGDTATADTTRRLVRKPLEDDWTRKLAFRRVAIDSLGNPIWHVVGTSGVDVTSHDATTQILSVRVQAGSRDTLITDPLALYRMRRIMWFPHDTPVTVTVTTGRPDDIVVLYHFFERRRFTNNGDNTYTATFSDGDFPGLRHFGVNAFSRGTLWDDTAPYDSKAWVLPFGVRQGDCDVDRD
jgi:hypothetical protein